MTQTPHTSQWERAQGLVERLPVSQSSTWADVDLAILDRLEALERRVSELEALLEPK